MMGERITEYVIAPARPQDIAYLPGIELAAAQLLVGHVPEAVLLETTEEKELLAAQRSGRLWVARCEDVPVGFAHLRDLEPGVIHLDELDVRPAHGRRGVGSALVRAVCGWAAANGYRCVTLTTFRDLPWNMPFYSRHGFEIVPRVELGCALRHIERLEAARVIDTQRRVAMRYRLPTRAPQPKAGS